MSQLNVKVREIHKGGYNVQRRESWYCAIVSSETGETVLKAAELPGNEVLAFNENEEFVFSKDSILITIEEGKPVAISAEGKKVWAVIETK